jgi:hypothetical protein
VPSSASQPTLVSDQALAELQLEFNLTDEAFMELYATAGLTRSPEVTAAQLVMLRTAAERLHVQPAPSSSGPALSPCPSYRSIIGTRAKGRVCTDALCLLFEIHEKIMDTLLYMPPRIETKNESVQPDEMPVLWDRLQSLKA